MIVYQIPFVSFLPAESRDFLAGMLKERVRHFFLLSNSLLSSALHVFNKCGIKHNVIAAHLLIVTNLKMFASILFIVSDVGLYLKALQTLDRSLPDHLAVCAMTQHLRIFTPSMKIN